MPLASLAYFDWIRNQPAADQRRHDLLVSGMAPESAARLAARAGDTSEQSFADLAFASRSRIEDALGDLVGLPGTSIMRQSAGTGALFTACLALLDITGDDSRARRVLVESPSYEPMWAVPRALGAELSFFERSPLDGRLVDQRLPATDLILATHPHNPSGHALQREDLERLLDHARAHDAQLLLDAAYLLFLEDDLLPRPLPKELLVIGSLTKTLGLSALRVGFLAVGAAELRERLQQAYDLVEVYPPTAASELALRLAFDGRLLARGREHARGLQDHWRELGRALPADFRFEPPPIGVHAMIQLPPGTNDRDFARHAVEQHEVFVTPGSLFRAPGHIRIGCGLPLTRVAAALDALRDACHSFSARFELR